MKAIFLVALLAVGQADADRPSDKSAAHENEIASLLRPFFVRQAADYTFSLGSDAARELELVGQPVMTWNGDDSWFGDVFVWTHQGRPELIGCIGSWRIDAQRRGVFHEFHSLTTQPLSKVRIGPRYTWESAQPGISLQAIEGAPPPAASRRLRLLQMRSLAEDFSASMKSDAGMQRLRMQTPLFRYGEESAEDGAVFPFVWTVGTDPEALLLLETRGTGDDRHWCFAAARFTWRELWLHHKEDEVWHAKEHQEQYRTNDLKAPYATVSVENVLLADLRSNAKKPDESAAKNK